MWVWFVDVGHEVVLEHTPSLPCPHTFSPVHPYIFFTFFKSYKCACYNESTEVLTEVPQW